MKRLVVLLSLGVIIFTMTTGCSNTNTLPVDQTGESDIQANETAIPGSNSAQSDDQKRDDAVSTDKTDANTDSVGNNDKAPVVDATDVASIKGEFVNITDTKDILRNFKEFGFKGIYTDISSEIEFNYVSLGKESVDGIDTEHYKLTQNKSGKILETEVWINSEGKAIKAKSDNNILTGDLAATEGSNMYSILGAYIISLYIAEMGNLHNLMEISNETEEKINLGSGPIKIKVTEYSLKPYVYKTIVGIAPLKDKKIYAVVGNKTNIIHITRAVLR